MRRASGFLAFALLLAVLFAFADAKSTKMELSVQEGSAFLSDNTTVRHGALDQARALGATYVRQTVQMHLLHPCRGTEALRHLAQLNTLITDANARHLKIHFVLTGVASNIGIPRGCTGERPSGENPDLANYAKFVRKYVKYFSDKKVRRFSLWNKPNRPNFLCAGQVVLPADGNNNESKCNATEAENAQLFAKIYNKGYNVVKNLKKAGKIPKTVKIIFGEFAGPGIDFLANLKTNPHFKANGYSYHPHQFCTKPASKASEYIPNTKCQRTMKGIAYIPDTLTALKTLAKEGRLNCATGGKKPLPLYLTEFGYHVQCDKKLESFKMCVYGIPEDYRANWYVQALNFAFNHRVKGFTLKQLKPNAAGEWNTPLLDSNLSAKNSQSYRKIHAWAKSKGYKTRGFF
jgi:hypothetical protein